MAESDADVELIRSFANTIDYDEGTDRLDTASGLDAWLAERGLAPAPAGATAADLRLARRLRQALRDDLTAAHDHGPDAAPDATAAVAAELPLRLASGGAALEPAADGVRGALAHVVAAIARVRLRGDWPRLKLCPADDCRWVFYDASRNRSRRWCSMEVCGNRAKVRAYRSRSADL